MGKVYTIFKGNKSGSMLVVVPKGMVGFVPGAKVEWELSTQNVLMLRLKPLVPMVEVKPSEPLEAL